jgi:tRNA pseudouridine55 synthase
MKKIFAAFKPVGPTSDDIVRMEREISGERRVGHAGTLDPLASGVLVVGVGREATRSLAAEVAKEKEYIATIRLGLESDTDDEEGVKREVRFAVMPNREDVEKVLSSFAGDIYQVPPAFSAIKVSGTPSYKKARQGKPPELEARKVSIKSIEITDFEWPILVLRVVTGPGVYIRALARDVGKALGGGAYLAGLVRTRVGDFLLKDAIPPEKFREFLQRVF